MSDPITRARPHSFTYSPESDEGAPREATRDRPPRTTGDLDPNGYIRGFDDGASGADSSFTAKGYLREIDGGSSSFTDHGYIREFEAPTQKSADAQVDRGLFDAIRNFSPPPR